MNRIPVFLYMSSGVMAIAQLDVYVNGYMTFLVNSYKRVIQLVRF